MLWHIGILMFHLSARFIDKYEYTYIELVEPQLTRCVVLAENVDTWHRTVCVSVCVLLYHSILIYRLAWILYRNQF